MSNIISQSKRRRERKVIPKEGLKPFCYANDPHKQWRQEKLTTTETLEISTMAYCIDDRKNSHQFLQFFAISHSTNHPLNKNNHKLFRLNEKQQKVFHHNPKQNHYGSMDAFSCSQPFILISLQELLLAQTQNDCNHQQIA